MMPTNFGIHFITFIKIGKILFWRAFIFFHIQPFNRRFFKDRHWLFTEFPELAPAHQAAPERVYPADSETMNVAASSSSKGGRTENHQIFEIGCGVGNTILPILNYNRDPTLRVYGCDFSATAIDILREHSEFDAKRCEVFVLDATVDVWPVPFAENTCDIIVLIFVLSAIHPDK